MENQQQTYQLTPKGIDKLKAELEDLKTNQREKNLEALKEARAQGDLSENADYDAARDEQARIESRIKEIENILKHAEVISADDSNDKITLGKNALLKVNGKDPVEYTVVGSLEADPFSGKISNESPVGKAIIGHKKGDEIKFKTESGRNTTIKIIDVK